MKSNTFNYSLLAVGVAAVMGLSTGAMAKTTQSLGGEATINNVASATYKVGEIDQKEVKSNQVTITVTETAAFSLVATIKDAALASGAVNDDDKNEGLKVTPNGFVAFNHTLTNSGNFTDKYTMTLAQNGATGDIPATPNDDKNYDFTKTTVSYKIFNTGGGTAVTTVTDQPFSTFNANKIELQAGQYAEIVVNAKTKDNKGADKQNLTLTAVSDYLATAAPTKKSLTNFDYSNTVLPVFSIVKSVTGTINKQDNTSKATYKIVVTNSQTAYSAAATNATIIDNLPLGLKLVPGTVKSDVGTVVENTQGAGTVGSGVLDGFVVTGVNLAVNAKVTITFEVQQDTTETLAKSTVNHASVKDDLDEDASTIDDIVTDSTESAVGAQNTGTFYPTAGDSEVQDGSTPATAGGDSTAPLTSNERGLTLTGATTKEVPNTTSASPTNTQAKHETIITNTGKETEGDTAGEVKFKIVDNAGSAAVNLTTPVTITYKPKNGTAQDFTFPNVPADGIYDLKNAVNGTTPFSGMAPESTVTIKYEVSSTNAPSASNEAGSQAAASETTTVTLIPGGTDAPTTGGFVITDTTNVKGLKLLKQQAIDTNCNGTLDGSESMGIATLLATPNQCVIYRITAENTFSAKPVGFDITDVTISDLLSRFSNSADYKNDGIILVSSTNSTAGSVTKTTTAIEAGVTKLAPTDTATLQFSVKIKANAATVTPKP